jgi:hypothetical protein
MSFVTIVQRVLSYTGVRLHYGHPDIFDGYWCRFHVGLSKASVDVNLSEDIFFGFDNMSRVADCSFVEYIHIAKVDSHYHFCVACISRKNVSVFDMSGPRSRFEYNCDI